MRCKRAKIDSLNLSGSHIESIFIHHKDYIIETVKNKTTFNPERWVQEFGKPLTKNIVEAKIVHSHRGLCLPLKTFASTPLMQTVEFAGLYGYNERSEQMRATFGELEGQLQSARITRMDVAFDYDGEIPRSIIRALSKHRKPFRYGNTIYHKTLGEKKTNRVMDIAIYNKAHQAGLEYPLHRLEFRFKSEYLKTLLLADAETIYKKMEKSIKKFAGITVKINSNY